MGTLIVLRFCIVCDRWIEMMGVSEGEQVCRIGRESIAMRGQLNIMGSSIWAAERKEWLTPRRRSGFDFSVQRSASDRIHGILCFT